MKRVPLARGRLLAVILLTAFLPVFGQNGDNIGAPKFANQPLGTALQPGAVTIPYWSNSFSYAGTTYPYTMVGTDPATTATTTTVPVVLIPINVTFASDGVTLAGSDKVNATVASPIFQTAKFDSGTTQYGDAIQRANFWNYTASSDWHVLLPTNPTVAATQNITVPAGEGSEFTGSHSGAPIGLVNYYWWSSEIQNLMVSMKIDPRSVPVFLTYNTFLYITSTSNCCIIGYHGATSSTNGNGSQPVNTYIWASYTDPGIFSVPIIDINALSHEVAEWLNDPFVNNVVPSWSVPSEPQYGCSSYLEVGDPLVGVVFTVRMPDKITYHPQDEAFFPWFARKAPSTSLNGQYTYLGTFTTYSPPCQ